MWVFLLPLFTWAAMDHLLKVISRLIEGWNWKRDWKSSKLFSHVFCAWDIEPLISLWNSCGLANNHAGQFPGTMISTTVLDLTPKIIRHVLYTPTPVAICGLCSPRLMALICCFSNFWSPWLCSYSTLLPRAN